MMDPTYPLVPILNFLSIPLVVLPLFTSVRQRQNVGVVLYATWVGIRCLTVGVNTIVWKDNYDIRIPVWCDITSRLGIGASVAIPACSLIMTRRLYKITHQRQVMASKKEKRNDLIIDLCIAVGIPVIQMILYYVVQGARFIVFEQYGCTKAEGSYVVSILLVDIWTPILPLISVTFYAPRIIWLFYRQRKETNEFLSSSERRGGAHSQTLSRAAYIRVLLLASMDIVLTLPISVLVLITGHINGSLEVWPAGGWDLLHSDWTPIQLPASFWTAKFWQNFTIRWNEYVNPLFALVFFVIFGLTDEARGMYRSAWFALAARVCRYRGQLPGGAGAFGGGEGVEKSAIVFESFRANPVRSGNSIGSTSPTDSNSSSIFEALSNAEKAEAGAIAIATTPTTPTAPTLTTPTTVAAGDALSPSSRSESEGEEEERRRQESDYEARDSNRNILNP